MLGLSRALPILTNVINAVPVVWLFPVKSSALFITNTRYCKFLCIICISPHFLLQSLGAYYTL